jgi:hypothetical protein
MEWLDDIDLRLKTYIDPKKMKQCVKKQLRKFAVKRHKTEGAAQLESYVMNLQDEIKIDPETKVQRFESNEINPFDKLPQKSLINNLGGGILGEGTPNFVNEKFENRFAKLRNLEVSFKLKKNPDF